MNITPRKHVALSKMTVDELKYLLESGELSTGQKIAAKAYIRGLENPRPVLTASAIRAREVNYTIGKLISAQHALLVAREAIEKESGIWDYSKVASRRRLLATRCYTVSCIITDHIADLRREFPSQKIQRERKKNGLV